MCEKGEQYIKPVSDPKQLPSLISLMGYMDVKDHAYLFAYLNDGLASKVRADLTHSPASPMPI